MSEATRAFAEHRGLLFTVAYQMLGSVADAEDAVQDTWLRWSRVDPASIADPRAYLVQITTRLALDRLRSAQHRREDYVGPWLPEPLLTEPPPTEPSGARPPDPAEAAEVAEQVSLAMLVVLETLSPLERAVFVLREVFGLPVAEVARTLDRSESAVRQLAHRSREHVEARRPRFDTDRRSAREVTERFLAACVGGDVDALLAAMSPDVVLVTDGGGKAKAALRPIVGADKVARFLVATTATGTDDPTLEIAIADLNGAPAVVARTAAGPLMAAQLQLVGGRIEEVLIVRNPDKLAGLAHPPQGTDLSSAG
jgi:RNA polymerase sigma-70 factor (ECF subfamily)